jgi:hypothetical protein
MRTNGTRRERRWHNVLLGLNQGNNLNVLPTKVERSRCGEGIGLPHPPTASIQECQAFAQPMQAEGTDGAQRLLRRGRWPWAPGTRHCSRRGQCGPSVWEATYTARSREGILLTHFARSGGWPRLGSAGCRFLAARRPLPRNGQLLVRTPQPTATGHTLQVGFLQLPSREELLWEVPTRVSRPSPHGTRLCK